MTSAISILPALHEQDLTFKKDQFIHREISDCIGLFSLHLPWFKSCRPPGDFFFLQKTTLLENPIEGQGRSQNCFHCATGLKDSLSYENRRNSLDLEQNNRWWWCKNKCINWSAGHCSLTFEFELVKKVTKISVVSNLRSSSAHLLLWITNFFLVLLQEH